MTNDKVNSKQNARPVNEVMQNISYPHHLHTQKPKFVNSIGCYVLKRQKDGISVQQFSGKMQFQQ